MGVVSVKVHNERYSKFFGVREDFCARRTKFSQNQIYLMTTKEVSQGVVDAGLGAFLGGHKATIKDLREQCRELIAETVPAIKSTYGSPSMDIIRVPMIDANLVASEVFHVRPDKILENLVFVDSDDAEFGHGVSSVQRLSAKKMQTQAETLLESKSRMVDITRS